jgi:pre-rRNA-processing protein TSR4
MTMDPYDSDSSGFDDEGDFTETGVLLGYPSKEVIDDTISHLGGWPVCRVTGLARVYSY